MALALYDRVQQTGTANTTVSFTLSGSVTGYQSFSVIGNGNTTYYGATDTSGNWEVGIGTYATGGTLTRTTILASSNSGSAVTFSGTVTVFVTYPSERSVNLDGAGNVSALGTVSSGTWNGSTIGVAYGGTGVTTSSGANSVVLRDSSSNITGNNFFPGYIAVTAAAGTTVLTAASAFYQRLSGSTTQTFQLPIATTLPNGAAFSFDNDSSGTLTVVDSASGAVDTIPSGGYGYIFLEDNSTSAGSWGKYAFLPGSYNFNTSTADFGNATITNAVWNGTTIASGYGGTGLTTFSAANNALYSTSSSALAAGTLPIAAGGTAGTTAATAFNNLSPITTTGDLIIGTGTNTASRLGIGASTYVLTSNGTTASWSAPGGSTTLTTTSFTATSGQTTFTVTYTPALLQGVYRNGIKLDPADYTSTSGTAIVLATGAITGDNIQVQYFSSLATSTAVNTFSAGTTGFTPSSATAGAVTLAGTLNIANGGTGLTSFTASQVHYGSFSQSANLTFDGSNLGIGGASGGARLQLTGTTNGASRIDLVNSTGSVTANYGAATDGTAVLKTVSASPLVFGVTDTERMRIDSSGNVGIGTSSPRLVAGYRTLALDNTTGSTLDWNVNGTRTFSIFAYSGNIGLQGPTAADISITTNNTERMRITSAGDVGIGTSSPDAGYQLDVGNKGRVRLNPSTGTSAVYLNANNTGGSFYIGRESSTGSDFATTAYSSVLYSTGAYPMSFWTNATERMRIDSSGNVGIGTASPAYRLDVKAPQCVISATSTTGTNVSYLNASNTGGDFSIGKDSSGGGLTGTAYSSFIYSNNAYPMLFATNGTERMRIDSSGNVGIGTTSPSTYSPYTKLSVLNGVALGVDASNAGRIVGSTTTGTELSYLTMGGNYNLGSTGEIALATNTAKSVIFGTNATERMRINSGGYFTFNGANTNSDVIQMYVAARGASPSRFGLPTGSAFINGTATGANLPAIGFGTSDSGYVVFGTNDLERMRIDSSGNVKLSTAGTAIQNSSGRPMLNQTGGILQVVQGTATTNTTTTSSTFVTTGLSATITPSSTSSKILIFAQPLVYTNNASTGPILTIYRGGTNLGVGTYTYPALGWAFANGSTLGSSFSINYLDSPATTSATTYTVYFLSTSGGTCGVNQYNTPSTITLMEIAG
jgi:hypothetical protein